MVGRVELAMRPLWLGADQLILASKSPIRLALASVGLVAEIVTADINERNIEHEYLADGGSIDGLTLKLAQAKAVAASALNRKPIVQARIRHSIWDRVYSTSRAL